MDDEDVIDELGSDDTVENKINYLISFCTDPGDGSPNIQYCCVNGKELDDVVEYDDFDEVDFDDADSETLVDILLDNHEYEDEDDEWDEDDDFEEDDDEDEEDKIEEDMDLKYKEYSKLFSKLNKNKDYKKGETKMIDNKIKKFAEFLEKNGFEDNGMDSYLEINDEDVAYQDQGGYFSLTLVDKEEEIYLFKERDYETNNSYTLVIRGDEQFEDFLKNFKRDHVLDDINEEVDVDSVDKKLIDRLLRKVRRAMDEGQYYLEPTKEELKRFITILIEERGMDDWEGEDWELLTDSFFDYKEDSLDEILEWDYDINLDEIE